MKTLETKNFEEEWFDDTESYFWRCDLKNANFKKCEFESYVWFDNSDCTGADFSNSEFGYECTFKNCKLIGANFTGCEFDSCNPKMFNGADVSGAIFKDVIIKHGDLKMLLKKAVGSNKIIK